jgi:hypothetical protein
MKILRKNSINLKILAVVWMASLMLAVLAYMLLLNPQNRRKRDLQNSLADKNQTYELAQNASKPESQISLNEQIGTLRNKLKNFMVDSNEAPNLTFDISQIAQDKNVDSLKVENKSNNLTAEEENNRNNINERHIDISFNAGFNQFAAFLNALERHQPVLFVNQFKLIISGQGKQAYRVNMDVAALVKKNQQDKATAKDTVNITGGKL